MLRIKITCGQMGVTYVYRIQRFTYNVGYTPVTAYGVIVSSWRTCFPFLFGL